MRFWTILNAFFAGTNLQSAVYAAIEGRAPMALFCAVVGCLCLGVSIFTASPWERGA